MVKNELEKSIEASADKETTFKQRRPDYKNDGVAIWKGTGKNQKEYLCIRIVGLKTLYAFENK